MEMQLFTGGVFNTCLEEGKQTTVFKVNFCEAEASSKLKVAIANTGFRGMAETRNISVGMVLASGVVFINCASFIVQKAHMTSIHPMYPQLLCEDIIERGEEEISSEKLSNIYADIQKLKAMITKIFEEDFKTGFYSSRFLLLDHIVQHLKIWKPNFLLVHGSEKLIIILKMNIVLNRNSEGAGSKVHKTVEVLEANKMCNNDMRDGRSWKNSRSIEEEKSNYGS